MILETFPFAKRGAAEIFTMDSIVAMNVIVASAGLQSLLQDAPWEGQIAAVFRRGLLCTTPGEHLLHLHTGPCLASPFSLRIEADFANMLHATPFVQGMPVRQIDHTIVIAEAVHLRLPRATYYESARHLSGEVEREAIRHAHRTLALYRRGGGFDRLPGVQKIASTMHQALADGNAARLLEAAHQLIGLGPGLTPSGDDFLVGWLRGLWLVRRNAPGVCRTLDRLRDALLADVGARTSRVGAEFIRYAMGGAFAEVLDQAAVALVAPSHPLVVQSAVSHLLAQGETSGTDTMLGLLTCLEALLARPDHEPHHEWQDTATTFSTSAATRG
jgi:Protein of unknown function (DUF2877)